MDRSESQAAPTLPPVRTTRGRCTTCGAHGEVIAGAGPPRGVCAVCGGEEFEAVVDAAGEPAAPLKAQPPRGRFLRST